MTMAANLSNKVALITGGAQGFGLHLTRRLLAANTKVGIIDINAEKGQAAIESLSKDFGVSTDRLQFIECDVGRPASLKAAFDATEKLLGPLDIVCNNAGIPMGDPSTMIAINLEAMISGCYLARESMKGRGGTVLNTASMAAFIPLPLSPVYSATKAGVVSFTRSIAHWNAKYNVRVNVICPSFAETNFIANRSQHPEFDRLISLEGTVPIDNVVDGMMELITDETKAGATLRVTRQRGLDYAFVKKI